MTDGVSIIVWTAGALLGLVAAAFAGAALVPAFVLHQRRSHPRADRSVITAGRVFCRARRADIDVDTCVGCPHLRVMDGSGTFIVCDGRAAGNVSADL
jgi:hypothetical protein